MEPLELLTTWIGVCLAWGLVTLPIIGEGYASSLAERFSIGGGIAYSFFVIWDAILKNTIEPIGAGKWWIIIPFAIGMLSFSRMTKYRWAARYTIASLSGIGLGVFFGFNVRGAILAVITSTVNNLITFQPEPFSAIISFIAVFCVVTYFTYSEKYSSVFHSRSGKLYYVMKLGRLFMMSSFGYLMGYVAVAFGLNGVSRFFIIVVKRPILELLAFLGV